jgi:hypothetical protein
MSTDSPSQVDFSRAHQPARTKQHEERHSYLLRLWRSGAEGGWHASLQSVQTGERHMFADMESLLAFLVEQLRPPPV